MKSAFRSYLLFTLAAFVCYGAEAGSSAVGVHPAEACHVALLHNGFTINYVRQEQSAAVTQLWLCTGSSGGYVEMPTEQIEILDQGTIAAPASTVTPVKVMETVVVQGVVQSVERIKTMVADTARRYGLDPDFLVSVVKAESGFNSKAVSPKGARGLMQLMPATATRLGVIDIFDPASNVDGGTRYLRQLLEQYQGDALKALAAYNAGPLRVKQFGGVPPYTETRAYVSRIINDFNRKKSQPAATN